MLVDANSANGSGNGTAKSWPPPIAVPESLDDSDVPEYFQCPITGCIMRQPAMTPEGVTYDYDALVEWLNSKQTDPSTNLPLSADQLCPNRTVRSMIEDFIAKGPTSSSRMEPQAPANSCRPIMRAHSRLPWCAW